jgi:S-adenosylmethionine decarboxylase proenzyme
MQALSQHTLLEFYQCDAARLKHSRSVKTLLCHAVLEGGGTIVKAVFHNFSPHGVSGVVVITESHVTIHTWPEHAYAAVDIFSCSAKLDHKTIGEYLKQSLSARRVDQRSFARGFPALNGEARALRPAWPGSKGRPGRSARRRG